MVVKKQSLPLKATIDLQVEILHCSEHSWYAFSQTSLGFCLLCL